MSDPTTPAARPLPADVAGLMERLEHYADKLDLEFAKMTGLGVVLSNEGKAMRAAKSALEAQAQQVAELKAENARLSNEAVLKKAECDWIGSLLLDVQRDCIAERKARQEAKAENARLRELVRRIPNALSQAFAAGIEEREHGSARRQAKCLEIVDALRADALAAMKGGDNE